MVDSHFDVLKNTVRAARKSSSGMDFSRIGYNTHLELTVRLVTGAPSVNHFSAQVDSYPLREIPVLGQIIDTLRDSEHLIEPGVSAGEPPEYERYERWQLLAAIWLSGLSRNINTIQASSPLHELFCLSADLDGLRIPRMLGEGAETTVAQSAAQLPNEAWILSACVRRQLG